MDLFGSHVVCDLDVLLTFSATLVTQSVVVHKDPIFAVLLVALLTVRIETRTEAVRTSEREDREDWSAVGIVRVAVYAETEDGGVLIYDGGLGGMVGELEHVNGSQASIRRELHTGSVSSRATGFFAIVLGILLMP
jgi:hypothetical protein